MTICVVAYKKLNQNRNRQSSIIIGDTTEIVFTGVPQHLNSKEKAVLCTPDKCDITSVVNGIYVQQGPLPRLLLTKEYGRESARTFSANLDLTCMKGVDITTHFHSPVWLTVAPGVKLGNIDLGNKTLVVAQSENGKYDLFESNASRPTLTFQNVQELHSFVKSDCVVSSSPAKDAWDPIVE